MLERNYSTLMELQFIEGLGTHAAHHEKTRLQLLEDYRDAMSARRDWGDVNRNEVMLYVASQIAEERGKR